MNLEQQKQHFNLMVNHMETVMFKKGSDYANEDRLSNFKMAGAIAGGSAELNCLNLIATKVARLGVLLKSGKEPNNESIRDSVLDLANYAVLLDAILEDKSICAREMMFPGREEESIGITDVQNPRCAAPLLTINSEGKEIFRIPASDTGAIGTKTPNELLEVK